MKKELLKQGILTVVGTSVSFTTSRVISTVVQNTPVGPIGKFGLSLGTVMISSMVGASAQKHIEKSMIEMGIFEEEEIQEPTMLFKGIGAI